MTTLEEITAEMNQARTVVREGKVVKANQSRRTPMHARLDLAKLKLMGKFTLAEMDDAELELLNSGLIECCMNAAHEPECVVVR